MNVLEEACRLSAERWMKSLPDDIPENAFSKKHRRKMNRLFDKMRNDKYHRLTKRTTTVLTVAAVVLSFTITVFAFPDSRNFVIEKFNEYSVFSVYGGSSTKIKGDFKANYIPDGFRQADRFESDYLYTYDYENDKNQWFCIEVMTDSSNYVFDTEEYDYEEFYSGNTRYLLYKSSKDTSGVIWHNGNYIFSVVGNIPKNEILNIAMNFT